MRSLVIVVALTLWSPLLASAQDAPAAKVILVGRDVGYQSTTINGKTDTTVTLDLGDNTNVTVRTDQRDVLDMKNKAIKEQFEALKELQAEIAKLIKEGKVDDFKKATEAFTKAISQVSQVPTAAEGVLQLNGKTVELVGKVTPVSPQAKEKSLAVGTVSVEGQVVAGNYELGGGKKSNLAIQNGKHPIIVTGKAAEGMVSGAVRVVGKLRVSEMGQLVIEAEKLEVLKK